MKYSFKSFLMGAVVATSMVGLSTSGWSITTQSAQQQQQQQQAAAVAASGLAAANQAEVDRAFNRLRAMVADHPNEAALPIPADKTVTNLLAYIGTVAGAIGNYPPDLHLGLHANIRGAGVTLASVAQSLSLAVARFVVTPVDAASPLHGNLGGPLVLRLVDAQIGPNPVDLIKNIMNDTTGVQQHQVIP